MLVLRFVSASRSLQRKKAGVCGWRGKWHVTEGGTWQREHSPLGHGCKLFLTTLIQGVLVSIQDGRDGKLYE